MESLTSRELESYRQKLLDLQDMLAREYWKDRKASRLDAVPCSFPRWTFSSERAAGRTAKMRG